MLASILRTEEPLHRALPSISDNALTVKALARQHQEAIWSLHQTISRLRSVLLEFYSQALQAFPNLKHKAALTILAVASTPEAGLKLTRRKVIALLHHCGRRNDPALVEHIVATLGTPTLRQTPQGEHALGLTVTGLIAIIETMAASVDQLETALTVEFERHPHAAILCSAPGLGPALAARVLAELGDDPHRFSSAQGLRAFAGTAPITRASGRTRFVNARRVRNKRLTDACHWRAFAMLTKSPGARAHYDRRRAASDSHNAALRKLANKNSGLLWRCLQHDQPWDDDTAWPTHENLPDAVAA